MFLFRMWYLSGPTLSVRCAHIHLYMKGLSCIGLQNSLFETYEISFFGFVHKKRNLLGEKL